MPAAADTVLAGLEPAELEPAELEPAELEPAELEPAELASAESVPYYWPEHLPLRPHHLLG